MYSIYPSQYILLDVQTLATASNKLMKSSSLQYCEHFSCLLMEARRTQREAESSKTRKSISQLLVEELKTRLFQSACFDSWFDMGTRSSDYLGYGAAVGSRLQDNQWTIILEALCRSQSGLSSMLLCWSGWNGPFQNTGGVMGCWCHPLLPSVHWNTAGWWVLHWSCCCCRSPRPKDPMRMGTCPWCRLGTYQGILTPLIHPQSSATCQVYCTCSAAATRWNTWSTTHSSPRESHSK